MDPRRHGTRRAMCGASTFYLWLERLEGTGRAADLCAGTLRPPRGRGGGSSKAWTRPCAHTRTHTYTYTHTHTHTSKTHTLIITHHSKHIHAHIHTQHHTHTPHTANRTPHTPPFVVSIGLVDNCSHFLFKSFFVFGLSFGQRCFHN